MSPQHATSSNFKVKALQQPGQASASSDAGTWLCLGAANHEQSPSINHMAEQHADPACQHESLPSLDG